MRKPSRLVPVGFLATLVTSFNTHAKMPADAQALLDSLPGKKISMELVLGRAMQASDSFRAIKALLPAIEVPYLRSQTLFDTTLYARANRLVDRNEPQSPFAPNRNFTTQYTLGASSYFSTGTQANAELLHGNTQLGFQAFPGIAYRETQGAFTLTQNLWRDAFGYGARRTQRAGELLREANKLGFEEQVEDWTLTLTQVYYGAWLAQARTRVAEANVKRRQRLVDVTSVKQRRGTSELPDALQVRSALLNSEVQQAEADQVLGDRWRNLVTSLKLPVEWLKIDPKDIPIELDDPVTEALQSCGESDKTPKPSPADTVATRRAALTAEASRLTAESARNGVAPDIEVVGQLVTNGIDPMSRTTTFTESRTLKHPAWTLGLSVTVPLGQYQERATAHQAVAEQERAEAQASMTTDNLKLDWLNGCSDLARLQRSYQSLQRAYENQNQRASLEEQRFRIGRSSTLAVIQAGDDATMAEWNLRGAEVERRVAAWKVRRLAHGYKTYLQGLEARK